MADPTQFSLLIQSVEAWNFDTGREVKSRGGATV